jgi:transcription elongation factor GreA-like protein
MATTRPFSADRGAGGEDGDDLLELIKIFTKKKKNQQREQTCRGLLPAKSPRNKIKRHASIVINSKHDTQFHVWHRRLTG